MRTVQYRDLVDAWNARGYAVVVFEGHEGNPWISSQPYWCDHCEDLMCSWAWLQAHGTEYRLDPERVISFAHAYGLFAPLLAVADDALWTEMLATCPQPTPASKMVKGVAVYDGFYGLPDVDLILWRSNAASAYGVSYEAFGTVLDELTGVPPETWLDEGVLSPEARRIASFLPRAYLSDPRPDDVVPAFLIMTGDPAVDADAPVSEPMVAALTEAGLPVETWVLENGVYSSLIGAGTDAVADEVDAFAQRVFGDVQ